MTAGLLNRIALNIQTAFSLQLGTLQVKLFKPPFVFPT
jgi:hypothetical protein